MIRVLLASVVVFAMAPFACLALDDEPQSSSNPTEAYLIAIGWHQGHCAGAKFDYGLSPTCEVLPISGPGSWHPLRSESSGKSVGFPIKFKCSESLPDKGNFVLETAVDGEFLQKIVVKFKSDIPMIIEHYIANSLDAEYILMKQYALTDVHDEQTTELTKRVVGAAGDIEQFVCRGKPGKLESYRKLLDYNYRLLISERRN